MKNMQWAILFITLIAVQACKKDTNNNTTDLMSGAVEFTGPYPDMAAVSFTYNSQPQTVNAFGGQYIAFFIQGTSEADATQVINDNGGTILAKIPAVGYYLIENNSAAASTFMAAMQSNGLVDLMAPHTMMYPKAGALVLDHCQMDHGIAVQATLTKCHGTVERCASITTVKNNIVYGSDAAIIHGIIDEGNKNKTGPTFINLSFNGGLERNTDYDYNTLTQAEKDTFIDNYYWNMTNVLMSVAALRDEYRQNLVITIAAGNENFDLTGMMELLRQRPRIANILRDNVLIVSTEKIQGIHANYAYNDPDVVVLNNDSAYMGSSLATPCAMGYIQDIVNTQGVSPREALQAMKAASWMLPDREVTLNNAKGLIGATVYYAKGPFAVDSRSNYTPGQNYTLTEHVFNEVKITYSPHYNYPFITFGDCMESWTYYGNGTLYSHNYDCGITNYYVEDSADIVTFDPWIYQTHNGLVFKGNKSADGTKISGHFWIDWDPNKKVYVELIKQ